MTKQKYTLILIVALVSCTVHLCHTSPISALGNAADSTFEVDIAIADIKNFYGVDLKMYYTTDSLDLIEAVPKPPWENNLVIRNEITDGEGAYRLAMVGMYPSAPFTGNTTLATLTFLKTNPKEYNFQLTQIKLTDAQGNSLPYKTKGCTIQGLTHNVVIIDVASSARSAFQGDPIYLYVAVENQGPFPETFTVTVYADSNKEIFGDEITVGTKTVYDLPAGAVKTVNFVWDTTDVPYGSYFISAKASKVIGEMIIEGPFLKAVEYIGGIYPRPHLRQMFNTINELSLISLWMFFIMLGLLSAKKYWCL